MPGSPLRCQSTRDYSIDSRDMISLLPQDDISTGWLLSSSPTVVVSKLDVSKPLPLTPPAYQLSLTNSRTVARLPASYQVPSQRPVSIESESSDPGMVEDSLGWSDSDTSIEDDHNYHASASELWDSFWSERESLCSPLSHVGSTSGVQGICLSPSNRNFASTNLSALNISDIPIDLHGREATRSPHHRTDIFQTIQQTTYSPFPSVSTSSLHHNGTSYISRDPFPPRVDSRRNRPQVQVRTRAHTTPGGQFKVTNPSNLSTSTTLDSQSDSSGTSTPLYMRSAPSSPQFAPPPFMELMEKSVFDEDDDDDAEEKRGLVALASRLHIRSGSLNDGGNSGKENSEYPKRKSLRRSASEALKGVFGIKK